MLDIRLPPAVPAPPEPLCWDGGTDPHRWRDHAACRDTDPAVFFPVAPRSPDAGEHLRALIAAAKAICEVCPVAGDCLDYALTYDLTDGIWGGHTPDERRALTTQR